MAHLVGSPQCSKSAAVELAAVSLQSVVIDGIENDSRRSFGASFARRIEGGKIATAQADLVRRKASVSRYPIPDPPRVHRKDQIGGLGRTPQVPFRSGARRVETENGPARHTDAIVRHDAQDQRAGRQARTVDDDAFPGLTHAFKPVQEGTDLPPGASADALVGRSRRTDQNGEQREEDRWSDS